MNRRGFLGVMAKVPAIGAIAGKQLRDEAAAKLANLSIGGAGSSYPASLGNPAEATIQQKSWALKIPTVRAQLESLLFEDVRVIYGIDHDLASKRSFSLAAKVTYQRQRIVAQKIREMESEWPYQRINNLISRALGLKL